jgi:hypothetical protein
MIHSENKVCVKKVFLFFIEQIVIPFPHFRMSTSELSDLPTPLPISRPQLPHFQFNLNPNSIQQFQQGNGFQGGGYHRQQGGAGTQVFEIRDGIHQSF